MAVYRSHVQFRSLHWVHASRCVGRWVCVQYQAYLPSTYLAARTTGIRAFEIEWTL